MMYGLLLEGALAEEQQEAAAQQAKQSDCAEDESWCLGMEAWVRFDNVQAD